VPIPYWIAASAGLHFLLLAGWWAYEPEAPQAAVQSGPATVTVRAILSAPDRPAPEQTETEPEPTPREQIPVTEVQPPPQPAAQPQDTPPLPVHTKSGARNSRPAMAIVNPSPRYPAAAVRQRLEGTVGVIVHIDEEGRIARVEIDRSSGHGPLDASVLEVLKKWRFRPALQAGQAVDSVARQDFIFKLPD